MAFGYVIGGGGGGSLDPKGDSTHPIYVDANDELQKIDKVAAAITADNALACSGNATTASTATNSNNLYINTTATNTSYYILGATGTGNQTIYRAYNAAGSKNTNGVRFNGSTGVLLGAAWNDYAEFRKTTAQPGQVVVESRSGDLVLSTKRLQKGGNIVSDTYGFIIGDECADNKGIAVSGRVLAVADGKSKLEPGDAVCTGKNGTISKMNRLEIILFPDRIIGYISEIPNYKEWNGIAVNNRVWVKVI